MEVLEHEHPLKLIDLQLEYPSSEEEDEEEEEEEEEEDDDPITEEGFHGVTCKRCGQEIHMYHRYYYKCTIDLSCHFSLHKFCAELSKNLESPFNHPHPLFMCRMSRNWACRICNSDHKHNEVGYKCLEYCSFYIDVNCVVEVGKRIIYHPCHPHLLICAISKPILCHCNACGKRHEGIFYQCAICAGFTINSECVFLPKKLLIQQRTDESFFHRHALTISFSFPNKDRWAKHDPRCKVCGKHFPWGEYLWIYKCDKCMYYAHVDCASTREIFMPIFLSGLGKTIKNFEDADHPHLLHLPFPDETYSIPKLLFFQESSRRDEVNLEHMSHQHPLILVDHTQSNTQTINSWLLMCHNPMKKTKLLCNGCLRPIMSTMPFYKCAQSCNFALHEWCTRLPTKIENHPTHPHHTLVLMYSNNIESLFGVFLCAICSLLCNGFAYCCVECKYYIDVSCGFIPREITHKSHPNHLLSIVQNQSLHGDCHMCLLPLFWGPTKPNPYNCKLCNISIHPECALLLAETIMHKYDKHPMHLSYLPIENHKSEYFCEICEDDLNPHQCFYHCHDCVQSIHAACAPSILQSETKTYGTYGIYSRSIHAFVNINFGAIHNTKSHPHPLFFAQGIVSDGSCRICFMKLYRHLIFRCLKCKFAIHYQCELKKI